MCATAMISSAGRSSLLHALLPTLPQQGGEVFKNILDKVHDAERISKTPNIADVFMYIPVYHYIINIFMCYVKNNFQPTITLIRN